MALGYPASVQSHPHINYQSTSGTLLIEDKCTGKGELQLRKLLPLSGATTWKAAHIPAPRPRKNTGTGKRSVQITAHKLLQRAASVCSSLTTEQLHLNSDLKHNWDRGNVPHSANLTRELNQFWPQQGWRKGFKQLLSAYAPSSVLVRQEGGSSKQPSSPSTQIPTRHQDPSVSF